MVFPDFEYQFSPDLHTGFQIEICVVMYQLIMAVYLVLIFCIYSSWGENAKKADLYDFFGYPIFVSTKTNNTFC